MKSVLPPTTPSQRSRPAAVPRDYVVKDVVLPDEREPNRWDEVIVEPAIKDRLLHTLLLSIELRSKLPFAVTANHGLVLLYGPPGTGKTTLARSAAHEVARVVTDQRARLIEINPHGLMSAEHGRSQQQVVELFAEHIPLLADDGRPTIVVLDEVESMTVARSAASLSANPADVHRATDAVLSGLDRLTVEHPHIVMVATSNFTEALDEAFQSRADAAIEVPLPGAIAIAQILRRTLQGLGGAYPPLLELSQSAELDAVAARLVGLDGRQVRKLVTNAMASRVDTVIRPGTLTIHDLLAAADAIARSPRTAAGGQHAAA